MGKLSNRLYEETETFLEEVKKIIVRLDVTLEPDDVRRRAQWGTDRR